MVRRLLLPIALTGWLVAVAAGSHFLLRTQTTPAPQRPAADSWPTASSLPPPADRPRLVLFLHPHCPCSRVALADLAAWHSDLDAIVLFVRPPDAPPGWERGPLLRLAEAVPDLRLLIDIDGTEARRFGAGASGDAFLYAPRGHLVFRGGLTGPPGHSNTTNRDALLQALLGDALVRRPVFGCPLFSPQGTEACKP